DDEREQAAGVLLLERQLPAAADQGVLLAEKANGDVLESEFAHLRFRGLVLLAVAFQQGLPAARFHAAGEEGQVVRLPVAGHEAFQIALVPGLDLIVEDFADGFMVFLAVGGLSGQSGGEAEQDEKRKWLHGFLPENELGRRRRSTEY